MYLFDMINWWQKGGREFFRAALVLITACQTSYSQFKEVHGGLAHTMQARISTIGFMRAGGGVILKGKAKHSNADSAIFFKDVSLIESSDSTSTITIGTSRGQFSFSNLSWLMRDASSLVKFENDSRFYKEVDLLDTTNQETLEELLHYPKSQYFYVQVNEPLLKTKSGERLLLVDLLLTDPAYYSDPSAIPCHYGKYRLASDSLKLRMYRDDFRTIDDWTYNDESTNYRFECQSASHSLAIEGKPHFTFLSEGIDSIEVNTVYTNYFDNHSDIISNLNPSLFKDAETFGQIAAFFRYLKTSYPVLWNRVTDYYSHVASVPGSTPRIIKR
jgi:hypothetical protein